MTSKQEKLAAARKKLKEFQGKSKEIEICKQKNINDVLKTKTSNDFISNESVGRSSPLFSTCEKTKDSAPNAQSHQTNQYANREMPEDNRNEKGSLDDSLNKGNFSKIQLEFNNFNQNSVSGYLADDQKGEKFDTSGSDFRNTSKVDVSDSVIKNNYNNISWSNNVINDKNAGLFYMDNHGNNDEVSNQNESLKYSCTEVKKFFDSNVNNKSALEEMLASLQRELQSHSQTIAILVQERNDAQTALAETRELFKQKLGENEALGLQLTHSMTSVNNLSHRLLEMEAIVQKLNMEKEENLQKWNETKSLIDNFQIQLDQRTEELQEMRRKYEEKNNDCQQLLITLKEAQSQLSLFQFQQHSNDEGSTSTAQISELQSENLSLKQKIEKLKKELEAENAEKEESSQKFHIYAQQCNSQLSSLNSQLKSLKLEKESLHRENIILSKNLAELENAKEKEFSKSSYKAEITDLHEQISVLTEENKNLNINLKDQEKECAHLKNKIEEKESECNELLGIVKVVSEENKKLAREAETPKADERLLARMESDKVAAAKAVSQNQKLKAQVSELEQAFMKMSEEKLELTNILAHERHVTAELKNLLKKFESENHDHHHDTCQQKHREHEELVNDSDEVEELRSIVRQLQDDKMELTARLNFYESNKKSGIKAENENDDSEEKESEEHPKDTKLLLQQMKEKVRKTMNEIAILDEEKEKLEHLVLQLQGETETIGEYVTLYQKQRMLLRQRAQEKDSQLLQLSRDKEELKSKLIALDELVQRLLAERKDVFISSGSKLQELNSSVQTPDNTAGKIRSLINEIGSTALLDNQSIAYKHCSCCSGRLITI